ncbi:aspartate carbamoyltransferase [Spirochaeta thermophila]|uniref:Aspartate carbamoyltransferase n=1 Tax=Winmispira thermophila (strain ATCC 49972 / DSM 6192 / RI 19.B1) TaxID=665571 RepID=E0RRH0_WINT6|nr:aspartate carbamoyltransferase [Spirochaeta thermophila]ADN01671.1 hypothetical protein STHERM_c07130 [Spirochaeta thermophila DSM 6192]
MSEHPFRGRTIATVRDLSVDEQYYLYTKAREFKEGFEKGGDISKFRIEDPSMAVYLFFLEDSTRTKESFRNAALFHGVKVNDFNVLSSSFNKKESITDTVKMLVGYSKRTIVVTRSRQEGLCRWLEQAVGAYARDVGRDLVAFINGGDGKHEHPTQEFLDEFSFLEHLGWDRSGIHIALVGDLFHGRTVHSKVDGLKVFRQVEVDLIAPDDLAMPEHYVRKMELAGFTVRSFPSIEAYLSQRNIAPIWYFTRLQLERMGEHILEKAPMLRKAVTFRKEFMDLLPEGTRFYHPLPRHRETPTIPHFLDATPLNGWDRQSINGYFTRAVLLSMVAGKIGDDFEGAPRLLPTFNEDFVQEVEVRPRRKPDYKVGIKPVENGIVIDHIGMGKDPASIWNQIDKIRRILRLDCISSHGVYTSHRTGEYKGIISLPDVLSFDRPHIKMLGAIAPGCTLNIIKEGRVERKFRIGMPPRIYNFEEISCTNEDCISHPDQHEHVIPEFHRSDEGLFVCKYCERPHTYETIWRS